MLGDLWSRLRNYSYEKGFIKTERFPEFIISIGNLTWGGTGKSSLVAEVARHLLSEGLRVAIVSRGYRRQTRGVVIVSDGARLRCSWRQCGDEPYLLASQLQKAVIAVSEKRAEGIRAIRPFGPEVIILDDAFQHRKVERDLDILVVDASENITALRVMPFGKLREPAVGITRASAVVLTHFKQANHSTVEWIEKTIRVPIFHANYSINGSINLSGRKIAAFCAIGAPDHFYSLLQNEGAQLVATRSFRDHHIFSTNDVESFRKEAVARGAELVVTTEKDAVRLDPELLQELIHVIRVKLQIAEESLFFAFLSDPWQKKETGQAR